jgi:hypothetical protein
MFGFSVLFILNRERRRGEEVKGQGQHEIF